MILGMQSDVLREMFINEAIIEFKNDDFSVEAVEEVLRWMYTEQIPDIKNAFQVYAIAIKLEISVLKPIAEKLILENDNEDNAMEVLKLGNRNNSEKFKKFAFNQIKKFLGNPDLDDKLMDEPEKLEKLIKAKKNFEELMKRSCKKRKLNQD